MVGLLTSHLIGVAEGSRCREFGLKKDVSFRVLCEYDALSPLSKQRVLGISHPDSAKMREAEVGIAALVTKRRALFEPLPTKTHRRSTMCYVLWFQVASLHANIK